MTWEERNPGVATQAARLVGAAEAGGSTVETLPVDTEDHSRQLVARHPEVAEWVTGAVAACA